MAEILRPVPPRLEDLCGMTDARLWGEALARDLQHYIARRIPWSQVPRGVLVHGRPGTGKTIFAKALAATCNVPLLATSYSVWQRRNDGHLGDVLRAMNDDFKLAKKHAPCILFIDEIEGVGSREMGGNNQRWYTNVITALNEQLDGIIAREGVVVIAATNYPDRVDPALLRPGRLDARIAIPMPSSEELRGIARFHLGKDLPGADLGGLALVLVGSTGADVEKIVRDARQKARQLDRKLLLDDLFAMTGKDITKIDPAYLRVIAIHEAGHAVAAVVLEVSRNIGISLFQRGESSATTFLEPKAEAVTRKVVERRIAVALAGRAAERVILGVVTAGGGGSDTSDLAMANALAFSAVARWGLSDVDELRWVAGGPDELMSKYPGLDAEAGRMRDAANACAHDLIRQHATEVQAVADALLQRRALGHADILALMGRRPRRKKGGAKGSPGRRPLDGHGVDEPLAP